MPPEPQHQLVNMDDSSSDATPESSSESLEVLYHGKTASLTPTRARLPREAKKDIGVLTKAIEGNQTPKKRGAAAPMTSPSKHNVISPPKQQKLKNNDEADEPGCSQRLVRHASRSQPGTPSKQKCRSSAASPGGRMTRSAGKPSAVACVEDSPATKTAKMLSKKLTMVTPPKKEEAPKPASSAKGARKKIAFDDDDAEPEPGPSNAILPKLKSPSKVEDPHIEDEAEDEEGVDDEEAPVENPPTSTACNLAALRRCLETLDEKIPKHIQEELERVEEFLFPEWTDYLLTGEFNILVHGTGSKYKLLESYAEKQLIDHSEAKPQGAHGHVVKVEGFAKTINAKAILKRIEERCIDTLKWKGSARDLVGRAQAICEVVDRQDVDIFLVIHNIDGPGLRDPKQQEVLAVLAKSKLIHFIASVDHLNANLLWDEKRRAAFRWLGMHVPTFRCYQKEIFAGESRLLGLDSKNSGRVHTTESLQAVWHSMPVNSRKLLRKLVELLCEGIERVTFTSFLAIARKSFLTQSEITLRIQVRELEDHHIIRYAANEEIKLDVNQDVMIAFLEATDDLSSD